MTAIRTVWLRCDGCGAPSDAEDSSTVLEARAVAKKAGWSHNPAEQTGGADRCPDCRNRRPRRRG